MQTCGSCMFFSALSSQCRKNPPVVFPLMGPGGQLQFIGTFPPVKDSDGCGAHEKMKEN